MNISRILVIISICFFISSPAIAGMTTCKLSYTLKGWSFIYKEYKGTGVVTCKNGQRANVGIIARSVGLTMGKSEVDHGRGTFSDVKSVNEIFGTYVSLDSHAGATKAVEAWAMSKGEVSLALFGMGRGFDVGVSLGGFTITHR